MMDGLLLIVAAVLSSSLAAVLSFTIVPYLVLMALMVIACHIRVLRGHQAQAQGPGAAVYPGIQISDFAVGGQDDCQSSDPPLMNQRCGDDFFTTH